MILGIDEVGRGPWAGPLVVGAVVLGGEAIEGLTDSKKLTKKRRNELDVVIREKAAGYGLGWVEASEIDEIGLSAALVLATKRAVQAVQCPYHEIIIDGTINFLKDTSKGQYVTTLAKADLLVPSVSAASIIAKVARDNYMKEQDSIYEGYGFGSHSGYGTAKHRSAIDKLGITPLHRLSFAPLQKYRIEEPSGALTASRVRQHFMAMKSGNTKNQSKHTDDSSVKTTRQIGDASETVAANELVRLGHEIIDRNWKTKYCEVDIISTKDDALYFTEVKHRKNANNGDGLAAITAKKLAQMKYAAKFYANSYKLTNVDLRLIAIATTGNDPAVTDVVEIS